MAARFLIPLATGRGLAGRGIPFLDLHREMNRLFDDAFRGMEGGGGSGGMVAAMPRIDVHDAGDGLEISAELPGVTENDIDLRVESEMLTISGEKRNERRDEQAQIVERSYGSFQRAVQLPFAPDPDKVRASFNNGVLTIAVPRAEQTEKSRRIQVTSGQSRSGAQATQGAGGSQGQSGSPSQGGEDGQASAEAGERPAFFGNESGGPTDGRTAATPETQRA